jgi:DNA-binding transcriptional LysR family regulator
MELRRLRYFIVTAEELHVGRAAEKLGIAQPALSQQLKVLEQALGVRLFERIGRGIQLTPVGELFLPEARATVAQADRAANIARGAARGDLGRVEIGYVESAMIEPQFPGLIAAYHQRFPNVKLHLLKMTIPQQIESLYEHRIDIAMVRGGNLDLRPPLHAQVFSQTGIMIALPIHHPKAGAAVVRLGDLAGERFIVLQDTEIHGFFANLTAKLCREAGFEAEIDLQVGDLSTMSGLVAAGLGVSLVPSALTSVARADIVLLPLAGVEERMDLFMVRRRNSRSAPVDNFVAMAYPDIHPKRKLTK